MSEIWKQLITINDSYYVSNEGRIKRIIQEIKDLQQGDQSEYILNIKPRKDGYKVINIYNKLLKCNKKYYVHWLVALMFIQDSEQYFNNWQYVVLHGKEGVFCNHINNLSFGTHKENALDKIWDGTYQWGDKNPNSKLTNKQVESIRSWYEQGTTTVKQLTEEYNYSRSAIYWIIWY